MKLTAVVVDKNRPRNDKGEPLPRETGVFVHLAVQPTEGMASHPLRLLMPKADADALDYDDEVTITVERTGSAAPAEG